MQNKKRNSKKKKEAGSESLRKREILKRKGNERCVQDDDM